MNSTDIQAVNVNVLAEVYIPEKTTESGLYVGAAQATPVDIEYYFGTVKSVGENAAEECPGLAIDAKVAFSQFAGYTPPTTDCYTKIIRGHDIVAFLNVFTPMKKEDVHPTLNRVLVQVIPDEKYTASGLVQTTEVDPREGNTIKGMLVELGPTAKTIATVGDIVYFDPYVGNDIVNKGSLYLKTIHDHDILFTTPN
jgi:co-chaperonin GroES (HSP10)